MFYHKLIPFTQSTPTYPVELISSRSYYAVTTNETGSLVFGVHLDNSSINRLYIRFDFGESFVQNPAGVSGTTTISLHYSDQYETLLTSQVGGSNNYLYVPTLTNYVANDKANNLCSDYPRYSDYDFAVFSNRQLSSTDVYPRVENPIKSTSYPSSDVLIDCPSVAISSQMYAKFSIPVGQTYPCSVLWANIAGSPVYSVQIDRFLKFKNPQIITSIGSSICCDQTMDGNNAIIAEVSGSIYLTSSGVAGTWSELTNFPTDASWKYCEISDDGLRILAITATNVYFSPDAGATVYDLTTNDMTGLNMCTISGDGLYGYIASNVGMFMIDLS